MTGVVLNEQLRTIARCVISLESKEGDKCSVSLEHANEGRFRIDELAPGHYSLRVRQDTVQVHEVEFDLRAGQTYESFEVSAHRD